MAETKFHPISDALGDKKTVSLLQDVIRKSWPGYSTSTINQSRVKIESIDSISRSVVRSRLESSRSFVTTLLLSNISVFSPLVQENKSGYSVILPPLVEINGDRLVIVDGVHRILAAMHHLGEIELMTVSNPLGLPLPCAPCPIKDVRIYETRPHRSVSFPNYIEQYFRTTAQNLDSLNRPFHNLKVALSNLTAEASQS
jgi:hypothetical protein